MRRSITVRGRSRPRPAGTHPRHATLALLAALATGCSTQDTRSRIVVSVPEQRMLLLQDKEPVALYPISTSKFGIGDSSGSYATPPGRMRVARKIGGGLPAGGVLKNRIFTGEILPVDAPGRDPIVSRILWLRGLESQNRNAFRRCIYIHGTPEERTIGTPASYGCVRMRSRDVMDLYARVGVGAEVVVTRRPLPRLEPPPAIAAPAAPAPPATAVAPRPATTERGA